MTAFKKKVDGLWQQSPQKSALKFFAELSNLVRISLFQPGCLCCQNLLIYQEERLICHECRKQIKPYNQPVCSKCGKAIRENGDLCGDCLADPPPFRKHVSYARYEGVLKELILSYKFKGAERLKKDLANCLVELVRSRIGENFDWIVPVPEDRGRKRETKPVFEIGILLSRKINIPLMRHNLIKVKKTAPQVKLSQARRLRNLDGAFKIRDASKVRKKKVLLVDDVYTTGTTIKKCTRQLKRAGAEVVAITLARSV
ncbi:MAG: ComF family protein [Candidatus Aminicenantes bacterium]|nr:ComF family protein [Candidatus Aminicenantes bacterium]